MHRRVGCQAPLGHALYPWHQEQANCQVQVHSGLWRRRLVFAKHVANAAGGWAVDAGSAAGCVQYSRQDVNGMVSIVPVNSKATIAHPSPVFADGVELFESMHQLQHWLCWYI
jgi:hypothetical protein